MRHRALLLLLVPFLYACPESPQPPPVRDEVTPPPHRALAPSQVLRLAVVTTRATLTIDPGAVTASPTAIEALSRWLISATSVGLTRQDEVTAEVAAGMARSWQVSPDGTEWTFHLRDDIPWVWYDRQTDTVEQVTDRRGRPRLVTADDFVHGIGSALGAGSNLGPAPAALGFIEGLQQGQEIGVVAVDRQTLQVRLTRPASYLDAVADSWYMSAWPSWQKGSGVGGWQAGTGGFPCYGPFVLAELADTHVVLVKNRFWPGTESVPQPTVERIIWRLVTPQNSLTAYRDGSVDVVTLPGNAVSLIATEPELAAQFVQQPAATTYFYEFNLARPPFSDRRLRQAFALSVNRQALMDGVSRLDVTPAVRLCPAGLRAAAGAAPQLVTARVYDPARARALVDEVYPNRQQIPRIILAAAVEPFDTPQVIDLLADMWQETLGVEIEREVFDTLDQYRSRLESGPQPAIRMRLHTRLYADAHSFFGDLFPTPLGSAPGLISLTGLNRTGGGRGDAAEAVDLGGWRSVNRSYDNLVELAASSFDTAQRATTYASAEEILLRQEAVVVPIFWLSRGVLVSPHIRRTFSRLGGKDRLEKWSILQQN